MITPEWFDDIPVLGKLSPAEAAAKLREIGEEDTAIALEAIQSQQASSTFGTNRWWWPFQDKPWQHTAHAFGYLAPSLPTTTLLPIQHAGNIIPDPSLKNARIKITLDRLRIANYPGAGIHCVLFDFYAQNQAKGTIVEHLHFNATYRVKEGEQAAILGYPIFVGLKVGTEGVAFKCFTVNVKNTSDETFLSFLESDVFRAGLKLATTAQPVIAPFSAMAYEIVKNIATRNRNVPVQEFSMGLDFSNILGRARLAEGSYLAVQIPQVMESIWNWYDWVYDPSSGQVVKSSNPKELVPFNYVMFSVSRYANR